MRKIISLLVLSLLVLVMSGCVTPPVEEERTYMADGTYEVWAFNKTLTNLINPETGAGYVLPGTTAVKRVYTPVLSIVRVIIYNDEIVSYEIDELQSKAYIGRARTTNALQVDVDGNVTAVTWVFNDQSKRELEYGYGMEKSAHQGEWISQIIKLENNWLKNTPEVLASVSITHDNYVTMALQAIQNAKDGKVGAIVDKEHYTYDTAFVTADINAEGKLSNLKMDARLFGNANANTYDPTHADYLVFDWNEGTKYDTYPEMRDGKTWQAMIDLVVDYIEENGWDGSINAGTFTTVEEVTTWADKGLHINREPIEALSSVTIQLSRDVLALNKLFKYFPFGWE